MQGAPHLGRGGQDAQVLVHHGVDVPLGGEGAERLLDLEGRTPDSRLPAGARRQVDRPRRHLDGDRQHPPGLLPVVDHRRLLRAAGRGRVGRVRPEEPWWAATAARCTSLRGTSLLSARARQSSYSGVACITSPLCTLTFIRTGPYGVRTVSNRRAIS